MPQEITAEERAVVMRYVMATIELSIQQPVQDALVMLTRQGHKGQALLVDIALEAGRGANTMLVSSPVLRGSL